MKLACWNVNSIRARLPRLLAWLEAEKPDVVCLQELKVEEAELPRLELEALGYRAAVHGQRTYNGVGILARHELHDVVRGLGDDDLDAQARLIAATVEGVRVVCVYVPNGSEVGSDKWDYKRAWLARLRRWLDNHADAGAPLALCGDFNVAPEARDVCDPAGWEQSVLYHPEARAALANVTAFGLRDTLRLHHAEPGLYSWWDYRRLSFPKNQGLRIDLILATTPLAERCTAAGIHRAQRKGQLPSDHAPIWAEFAAAT